MTRRPFSVLAFIGICIAGPLDNGSAAAGARVDIATVAGGDFGARVMAGNAQLPPEGGVLDARHLAGPQDWTTPIVLRKAVTLYLPCTTIKANDANLVLTAANTTIANAEIAGCGADKTVIVSQSGIAGNRNRVIRVLGNYAPLPGGGRTGFSATGAWTANSAEITNVTDDANSPLAESLGVGDPIAALGSTRTSSTGVLAPVVAVDGSTIKLAYRLPVAQPSGHIYLTPGGYRPFATTGAVAQGSNEISVADAGPLRAGDVIRMAGNTPAEPAKDMFFTVLSASPHSLTVSPSAAATFDDAAVIAVAAAGEASILAQNAADVATLHPGDLLLVGEWLMFTPNFNADWRRLEWAQVRATDGTRILLDRPLRASYGAAPYAGATAFPWSWRKVTGAVVSAHLHDFTVESDTDTSMIAVEAQNGRQLEVDHLVTRLQSGTGFETVNQDMAHFHDNSCRSAHCGDFGGFTEGRIERERYSNTGPGTVTIFELGSARSRIAGNQFLNAAYASPEPNVAALAMVSADDNTVVNNVLQAGPNVSCINLLSGEGNTFIDNRCNGGSNGLRFADWVASFPIMPAIGNRALNNQFRGAATPLALGEARTASQANRPNIVQ